MLRKLKMDAIDKLKQIMRKADHNTVVLVGGRIGYELNGKMQEDTIVIWYDYFDAILSNKEFVTDSENMHLYIRFAK